MRKVAERIARKAPIATNWLWERAYPLFRRDEFWLGDEYGADRDETFTTIFEENRWGSEESASGDGSSLDQTIILRRNLPALLRRYGVGTLLDAPCGDYNWMRHVELPSGVDYIGGEIVRPLVDELGRRFSAPGRRFVQCDIVAGPLPVADLWLCRDVLFHLANDEIIAVLRQFAASDIERLLTTTYPIATENRDIRTGGFRFINLCKPPFNLPPPELMFDDYLAPHPPRKLGLWTREAVRAALGA